MRWPVDPTPRIYKGPCAGDRKVRRKFLILPRTIGDERVWLEHVWKISVYEYIPGWDSGHFAWRFSHYELCA